jgi:hypothetical protein
MESCVVAQRLLNGDAIVQKLPGLTKQRAKNDLPGAHWPLAGFLIGQSYYAEFGFGIAE